MASLGKRIRQRKRAAAANDSPAARQRADDQHQLMLAGLWQMRRDLKSIKSVQRKIDYKREHALPQLEAYIAGALEAATGAEDPVLMTAMVWRFDVGDLAGGLAIARYALAHGLAAPDQYKRDVVTIVADEVADRALEQLTGEAPPTGAALAELQRNIDQAHELTDAHDLHDQVRAKLHKAGGYAARAGGELRAAHTQLTQALAYNERAGVKKDIERLESQLKKQTTE